MVGLAGEVSQKIDLKLADTLLNNLFEKFTKDGILGNPAIDLAAINIQRGRDHGIPSYTKVREICGLPPIKNFQDLLGELLKLRNTTAAASVVAALERAYK
jgi:peroxidase